MLSLLATVRIVSHTWQNSPLETLSLTDFASTSCHDNSPRRAVMGERQRVNEAQTRKANQVHNQQHQRMRVRRSLGNHGSIWQWKDDTPLRPVPPPRHTPHEN